MSPCGWLYRWDSWILRFIVNKQENWLWAYNMCHSAMPNCFFCHYYQTIPSLKCRSDIISDRGYEHFFFFLFALFFFLTFFSHFLCICVSFGVNYDSSKFDRKLKGSWEIRLFQYRLRIQSFSIRSFQLERHWFVWMHSSVSFKQ